MIGDCLDYVTTKIDKVDLFDSATGELVTSFKPEEYAITTEINSVPFVTFDCKNYESYNGSYSYIKAIDELVNELNKKEEEKMIRITDVSVKYEKKSFVDKTKRDENGNYVAIKKEVPVATIVTFENGSIQTAYCDKNDEFNLEVGISICVTRELMKRLYGISGETNKYNKVIRQGLKVYKNHCKYLDNIKKKIAESEAIEKNRKIKEQKRREKRAAKKKEREIEILAEAIRRANADSK